MVSWKFLFWFLFECFGMCIHNSISSVGIMIRPLVLFLNMYPKDARSVCLRWCKIIIWFISVSCRPSTMWTSQLNRLSFPFKTWLVLKSCFLLLGITIIDCRFRSVSRDNGITNIHFYLHFVNSVLHYLFYRVSLAELLFNAKREASMAVF